MMTRRAVHGVSVAQIPAPLLVVGGVVGLEGGATIAATLIPVAGVAGTVALRLGFGAVGLNVITRSRVRHLSARSILMILLVGAILLAHHVLFYAAIGRLPLGVAVTLEFTGPLAVALAGSKRLTDLIWAALAALGVTASSGLALHFSISLAGVAFAIAAGMCWAGYIVAFPRLARLTGRAEALALVTLAAALGIVPYALATDWPHLWNLHVLLVGAAVAVCSDVVAYSLQAQALRRISGALFSVLSSTEPGVGALFGLAVLDQDISGWQWAGMLAVTAASLGATLNDRKVAARSEVV